ncbi:MAG: hypothetical protein P4L46_23535 [Fimbriimonas sp.]|nr:hypothetical protein [Fimbriimonas sp.]
MTAFKNVTAILVVLAVLAGCSQPAATTQAPTKQMKLPAGQQFGYRPPSH